MRNRILAAVIAAFCLPPLLIPQTAIAHTDSELIVWEHQWDLRYEYWTADAQAHGWDLTLLLADELAALHAERRDMIDRHRCQLENVCPRPVVRASASRPSSGTGMGGNWEQWRPLVSVYFAPGDVEWALCIIRYESGGNPLADNPRSSASGLMQHLYRYWPDRASAAGWAGASIWDPEANIAVGAWLLYHGGAGHWTTNSKC